MVLRSFGGYIFEFDLAIYLLNNALVLEEMSIDRETSFYTGDGERGIILFEEPDIKREQIYSILCSEVPSTTRLVLL